jgi:DNA-binding HxlR family transcriptional regulator
VSTLLQLSHNRWSIPVVAEIARTRGTRSATLMGRLGVSGESLRRTLASLQELGLVVRNPGYGHPLRPEYLLTGRGAELAPAATAVAEAIRGHEHVALRKWSLPVMAQLQRPRRFSELRALLPEATPRALTLALKELQAAGLASRQVTDSYPPAVAYTVTARGRPVADAAAALG